MPWGSGDESVHRKTVIETSVTYQESIPASLCSLEDQYDNSICPTVPPGYMAGAELIPRLLKRIQIGAQICAICKPKQIPLPLTALGGVFLHI
jgi:hypothetical protein